VIELCVLLLPASAEMWLGTPPIGWDSFDGRGKLFSRLDSAPSERFCFRRRKSEGGMAAMALVPRLGQPEGAVLAVARRARNAPNRVDPLGNPPRRVSRRGASRWRRQPEI